jgi:deazaflavin-dependent oxidoreductase (nitroreductase family)
VAEFDFNAWNKQVITEFRANEGKVGGAFKDATVLVLHSTGAKSGAERLNPLVYLPDGDNWVIIASKGGAPKHPDWYHNLVAHPTASIEVGTDTIDVDVKEVTGPERDKLYAERVGRFASFGDYEKRTTRKIPVLRLTRKG